MATDHELDDLDRRIAEAMGWTDIHTDPSGRLVGITPEAPLGQARVVTSFSRNLESAWAVVLWMWQTHRLGVALGGHANYWWADFSVADCALLGDEGGATPAEAICRAALDALGDQPGR